MLALFHICYIFCINFCMKKFSKKSILFVCKSLFFLCLIVVLIIFLPLVGAKSNLQLSYLYETFVGKKCKYQGIIEIWNIDSFEGGTASKTSFLEKVAREFEKQNKGAYFLVRNVTEQECINMLSNGSSPDLFSCSYGVADKIKDYIQPFTVSKTNISQNYLDAGKINEGQYALPWCRGVYCLISTKANLEKAKADTNISLASNCLKLGYEIQGRKKKYTVYSLSAGTAKYLMPQKALLAYNVNMLEDENSLAFNRENFLLSTYSAYCSFVTGESVMFLGTQRDIARMENRAKSGKVADVVYQPLQKYNDLVQYLLMARVSDNNKQLVLNQFAEMLTGEKIQNSLFDIGMFPVTKTYILPNERGVMYDIALENIAVQSVPKLFN